MNQVSVCKKIFLSAKGATSYDTTMNNVTFNIPQLFPKDNNVLYNTIKILHAEIPYSFYIIDEYNDKLVLSTGLVTLTHGNYNASTFMDMISPKLPTGMSLFFDPNIGKFTFHNSTAFTIFPSTCAKLMGLPSNALYGSTLVSPYIADFSGSKNLYVNFPSIVLDNYYTEKKTYTTLACVPNVVPPYGIIFYDNRTASKNVLKAFHDDMITVQILDDNGNLLDFNGNDWSITLEIESVKNLTFNKITL